MLTIKSWRKLKVTPPPPFAGDSSPPVGVFGRGPGTGRSILSKSGSSRARATRRCTAEWRSRHAGTSAVVPASSHRQAAPPMPQKNNYAAERPSRRPPQCRGATCNGLVALPEKVGPEVAAIGRRRRYVSRTPARHRDRAVRHGEDLRPVQRQRDWAGERR